MGPSQLRHRSFALFAGLSWAGLAVVVCAGCTGETRIALLQPDDQVVLAPRAAIDEPGGTEASSVNPSDAAFRDQAEVSEVLTTRPTVTAGTGAQLDPPRQDATADDGDRADSEPIEDAPVAATSMLLLRYDFEGEGDTVTDLVGEADGRILGGATLDGSGSLQLDGDNDYVDMPNGILSDLESLTITAWLSWGGGACWQRVFDFGSTDEGEDFAGNATTSLFLTPASCPRGVLTFMTERTADKQSLLTGSPLPADRQAHVTLVLDGARSEVSLYVDGELQGINTTSHSMQDLRDVNNWLGRSQWIQDRFLRARYDELRIYGAALTPDEVADLHARGPEQP